MPESVLKILKSMWTIFLMNFKGGRMEKLTLEKALELHRQMWEGVAEKITADVLGSYWIMELKENVLGSYWLIELKENVLKEMDISPEEVVNSCFMCQYVADITGVTDRDDIECGCCPLEWNAYDEDECACFLYGSPYHKLINCMKSAVFERKYDFKAVNKLRKLALEIANLPVKEGYDEDGHEEIRN